MTRSVLSTANMYEHAQCNDTIMIGIVYTRLCKLYVYNRSLMQTIYERARAIAVKSRRPWLDVRYIKSLLNISL